jgi:hypothetical protein
MMTRILLLLASADGLLLLISFGLGVTSKLRGELANPSGDQFFWWYHFVFGLSTALYNLFVHCIIFVYFLGTGRLVKEIKLAYKLPDEPWPKLTRDLKRRVFPPALFAMLIGIATVAAGAAAQVQVWPWEVHATLGTLTLLINFWAFAVEYDCVRTNIGVLDEVFAEIDQIRARLGLPSNAEALLQAEEGAGSSLEKTSNGEQVPHAGAS